MKAIKVKELGAPEVMMLDDVDSLKPGHGQVVVSIKAAGVNPVDTYIRAGMYPITVPLPYTPGADGAGVVKAVGENVFNVKAGENVYVAGSISGTYAEEALCTQSQVFPLPKNISFAQGAALGVPYATAHRALFHRAKSTPGEFVLVHGASGGVGIAAVQLARAFGLKVIGTAGTSKGLELIKKEGAHEALDHRSSDYMEQVLKITGNKGVDVILEMLANVNLAKDLKVLALNGRVIVIGNRGSIEIDPRETMVREADIRGMTLFNVSEDDKASIHSALIAGLTNGTLRPIINTELPLAKASQAHTMVMAPGAYGKIVLKP